MKKNKKLLGNVAALVIITAIVLTFTLPNRLEAQSYGGAKIADTYILTGSIDNKYPITMRLRIDKERNVSGYYYYHSQKRRINISGSATRTGIVVEEKVDYDVTGEFVGQFDSSRVTFSGNWINAKTKKSMQFSLSKDMSLAINHIEGFEVLLKGEDYKYSYSYDRLYGGTISSKILNILNNAIYDNIKSTFYEFGKNENMPFESKYSYDFVHGEDSYDPDRPNHYLSDNSTALGYFDENIVAIRYYGMMGSTYSQVFDSYGDTIYNIKTGRLLGYVRKLILIDESKSRNFQALFQKKADEEYFNGEASFDYIAGLDESGIYFTGWNGPSHGGEIHFTYAELKPYVDRKSPLYYLFE